MKKPGFTLTEVLVAIVLTLILLGLMIRTFAITGEQVARGRALLEMGGQLRTTSDLLRKDLSRVTVEMRSFNRMGSATGYFEYIEGQCNDSYANPKAVPVPQLHTFRNGNVDNSHTFGDVDDILMFTARSLDEPFRGRFNGAIIESNYAEIIWWTVFDDVNGDNVYNVDEPLKLFRRVLLIRPDLTVPGTTVNELLELQQLNDISLRFDVANNVILTNSMSDLAIRGNRFARAGTTQFPFEPNYALLQGSNQFILSNPTPINNTTNLSQGEDVLLTSLAAFDVQAFDPAVALQQSSDSAVGLSPSDPGYNMSYNDDEDPVLTNAHVGFGGYVDLNSGVIESDLPTPPPSPSVDGRNDFYGVFTAAPTPPFIVPTPVSPPAYQPLWTNATYCTWSSHYEMDGLDTDFDGTVDDGTNNIDENGTAGPDDVEEYEARPPYAFPLRGIKITIRIVEPTTQLVRQTTVISNFMPE